MCILSFFCVIFDEVNLVLWICMHSNVLIIFGIYNIFLRQIRYYQISKPNQLYLSVRISTIFCEGGQQFFFFYLNLQASILRSGDSIVLIEFLKSIQVNLPVPLAHYIGTYVSGTYEWLIIRSYIYTYYTNGIFKARCHNILSQKIKTKIRKYIYGWKLFYFLLSLIICYINHIFVIYISVRVVIPTIKIQV